MSGYPNRTKYDMSKNRQKYLNELALRIKLDDDNLQGNKIYQRTGAISRPPDTRTTTEKLADLYRLRIDIRSKLGTIMSAEDANKVVEGLDQQELVFLTQRLDKFIQELKPKYALGVPYLVFNTYLRNAIRDSNKYGDLDVNRAILEELSSNTEETRFAIDDMTREIQLSGQKEIIFKLENINNLKRLINEGAKLLSEGAVNPDLEPQVSAGIKALEDAVITKEDLSKLQRKYEMAVRLGDVDTQNVIRRDIIDSADNIAKLTNEIDDLKQVISETYGELQTVPITSKKIIPSSTKIIKYEEPYEPGTDFTVQDLDILLQKLLDKVHVQKIPIVIDIWDQLREKLLNSGLKITKGMKSGRALRQKLDKEIGVENAGDGANLIISENQDAFNRIFAVEAFTPENEFRGISGLFTTPTTSGLTANPIATLPTAQPAPPTAQPTTPTPTPTPTSSQPLTQSEKVEIFDKIVKRRKDKEFKTLLQLESEISEMLNNGSLSRGDFNTFTKRFIKDMGNEVSEFIRSKDRVYFDDPTNITNTSNAFDNYLNDQSAYYSSELGNAFQQSGSLDLNVPPTPSDRFSTIWGGSMRKKIGKTSRMKGKGVSIDYNSGIRASPDYVPFGKYILNVKKLQDGIFMIKRPNGGFMGELPSKRVSSKLQNVFKKIVGGGTPSFNEMERLDDDEREYLHYVAKRSNILDKLQVPTPRRDNEEQMTHRYEVLRGQLLSGNDNKEMIKEFKKLILDMADKKLLPRRQVSDILIDLERM